MSIIGDILLGGVLPVAVGFLVFGVLYLCDG